MLRTKIRVPDFRGPNPNIGYDIESIKVGDSIQIQDNTYNGHRQLGQCLVGQWHLGSITRTSTECRWGDKCIAVWLHYVDLEIGLPQPALQEQLTKFSKDLLIFRYYRRIGVIIAT